MKLYDIFIAAAVIGMLIYLEIQIIDLRWQMAELRQNKPAFYLVESITGRHLKLAEIK